VANTPLPTQSRAFDIGTGTGVLAAVLAKRGVASSGSWIVSESLHEAFEATMPPWRRVPMPSAS
jgi:methylase of polypeptide subunit release factors